MVLIQLLLPTTGATRAGGVAPLAETRRELTDQFNGLTAYLRSPAKGSWTASDGHTEEDDVVMVEIVTERFDRSWWRNYAARLAARFDQESIHVRAVPVDMLDEGFDLAVTADRAESQSVNSAPMAEPGSGQQASE